MVCAFARWPRYLTIDVLIMHIVVVFETVPLENLLNCFRYLEFRVRYQVTFYLRRSDHETKFARRVFVPP